MNDELEKATAAAEAARRPHPRPSQAALRVYLAAPFFGPAQVAAVERLEVLLSRFAFDYYSPRKDGVLQDMTPEERRRAARTIFERNCSEINASSLVLALVDGRDTGVIWEMGYACASGVPIVTYTEHDYGLNVMIKESVAAHCRDQPALVDVLTSFRDLQAQERAAYLEKNHRQFDPRTF